MRKKPKINFVGLHGHSTVGSISDGYGFPKDYMEFAYENGMNSLALTDHGNMCGLPFQVLHAKKMNKEGKDFHPIYGVEAYYIHDLEKWKKVHAASKDKKKDKDSDKVGTEDEERKDKNILRQRRHLVVLAKNQKGLTNLYKLISISHKKPYMYYSPRIDLGLLKKHSEGLIVTSACLGGVFAGCFWENYDEENKEESLKKARADMLEVAKDFQSVFGEDFYGELQWNRVPEQHMLNHLVIDVCGELGIELITAVDHHYPSPQKWKAREFYKRLGFLNRKNVPEWIAKPPPEVVEDMDYHLYPKNGDEVWESFLEYRVVSEEEYNEKLILESIERTHQIAFEKIERFYPDNTVEFPSFVIGEGENAFDKLETLTWDGLKKFGLDTKKEYIERNKHELRVIKKIGMEKYFLAAMKIVNEGRQIMFVSPARGSSGGSLVCFCLKITEIDPVKFDLPFSRFLREDQTDFPDIDMDFARRDEMVQHLMKVWGEKSVVPITNLTTLNPKSLIKDVSKMLEIDFKEVNGVTRKLDTETIKLAKKQKGIKSGAYTPSYEDYKEFSGSLQGFLEAHPKVDEIVTQLLGQIRSRGKHAGGVAIGDDLTSKMPLISVKGMYQTPWCEGGHFRHLEPMGHIKYDILAISTMNMVENCCRFIVKDKLGREPEFHEVRAFYDKHLHPSVIDEGDLAVWNYVFREGNFFQTFQATAEFAQQFIQKAAPTLFIQFATLTSIGRPGPLGAGVDKKYLKLKQNPENVKYVHPIVERVLGDTFGLIVFQEDIAKLTHEIGAGISEDEGQKIRKLLTKKGLNEDTDKKLNEYKIRFMQGADQKGFKVEDAAKLWEEMEYFSGYGFSKIHALAYSIVSYMCAWLSYYHPLQWATAVLREQDDKSLPSVILECEKRGFSVRTSDVQTSGKLWEYESPSTLIQPLTAIKGVGQKAVEEIMKNRPYKDVEDFIFREDMNYSAVNKTTLERLSKVGALDCLVDDRFDNSRHFYECVAKSHKRNTKTYVEKFLESIEETRGKFVDGWSREEIITNSKELMGMYPFHVVLSNEFLTKMKDNNCKPISQFNPEEDMFLWFIPIRIETKMTKNNRVYYNVEVIDNVGGKKFIKYWSPTGDFTFLTDIPHYGFLEHSEYGYSYKKARKGHKRTCSLKKFL